jgi:hypothetical protein
LQFKINPVENLGFRPQILGFSLKRSEEESGWFVSPKLSPRVGDECILTVVKEGEVSVIEKTEKSRVGEEKEGEELERKAEERKPLIVAEEISKTPEKLSLLHNQIKKWIWENILLVFVLNDVLLLSLVGYKWGWFKKFHFKTSRISRIKPPQGGKSRKKRKK